MNVPMWNSGPEFRNTYWPSMPDHGAMSRPCAISAARRQHRRVRPAVERGGVDQQQRRVVGRRRRRDRRVGRVGASHASYSPVSCPIHRASLVAATRRGRPARSSPTLRFLPHDDLRREVVDHERELVGLLAPVRRAEHRADLAAREQQLLEPERVLSEPQHPIAGADARRPQRVGDPVDARASASRHVSRTSPSANASCVGPRRARASATRRRACAARCVMRAGTPAPTSPRARRTSRASTGSADRHVVGLAVDDVADEAAAVGVRAARRPPR